MRGPQGATQPRRGHAARTRNRRRAHKRTTRAMARVVAGCEVVNQLVTASRPEALAAQHRLAARGTERDFCGLPTIATSGREHLARATVITAPAAAAEPAAATAAAIRPRRLASLTTRRAPFWLGKTALRVEVLLAGSKYELLITVSTNQNLVRVHESPELLSVAAPSVSSRLRVRGPVGVLLGRVRGRPAGYAAGLYVRRWTLHRALPGRHLG